MLTGTRPRPGVLTRQGYERLQDERLHDELAMLSMRR